MLSTVTCCPVEITELTFTSLSSLRHSDKDNIISFCPNDVSDPGPRAKEMVFNKQYYLVYSCTQIKLITIFGENS